MPEQKGEMEEEGEKKSRIESWNTRKRENKKKIKEK
jgi:hypothetical protein